MIAPHSQMISQLYLVYLFIETWGSRDRLSLNAVLKESIETWDYKLAWGESYAIPTHTWPLFTAK